MNKENTSRWPLPIYMRIASCRPCSKLSHEVASYPNSSPYPLTMITDDHFRRSSPMCLRHLANLFRQRSISVSGRSVAIMSSWWGMFIDIHLASTPRVGNRTLLSIWNITWSSYKDLCRYLWIEDHWGAIFADIPQTWTLYKHHGPNRLSLSFHHT